MNKKLVLAAIAREVNFWYDVSLKTDSDITREEAGDVDRRGYISATKGGIFLQQKGGIIMYKKGVFSCKNEKTKKYPLFIHLDTTKSLNLCGFQAFS